MPTKYDRHRITRQWTLILLLIRHRYGLTLARLAELLHISRITLWRDLKALGDAGLPLEDDASGGEKRIRLRTSDLPALILSPLQVQALELSRRLLGPLEGTALLDAYDEILLRVGRTPRRGAVGPEGGGSPGGAAAHRRALESALAARRRVRLTYLNVGEAEARSREVEPLGWRFVKGELYLVAYDLQRRGERSFSSHRIRAVEALAEASERTASGEETGYFSAGEMLATPPAHADASRRPAGSPPAADTTPATRRGAAPAPPRRRPASTRCAATRPQPRPTAPDSPLVRSPCSPPERSIRSRAKVAEVGVGR